MPVGQNMQDHVLTIAGPFVVDTPESLLLSRAVRVRTVFDFARRMRTGKLYVPNIFRKLKVLQNGTKCTKWVTNLCFSLNNSGALAGTSHSGIGYVSTSVRNDKSWPDIQYTLNSFGIFNGIDDFMARVFNTRPGALNKYLGRYMGREKDANFVGVAMLRPKSVGEITLASRDPFASPIIQPNYFSHKDDMRAMIDGKF